MSSISIEAKFGRGTKGFASECSGTKQDPADWWKHQDSGSLQNPFRASEAPTIDPYRRRNEPQTQAYPDISSQPSFGSPASKLDFAADRMALANAKVVASFIGRVDSVGETNARVHLVSKATGECFDSQCDLEVLNEQGIGQGDEFLCEIVRYRGMTSTRLVKLAPKPVSKERVQEVRAKFKDRWNF